MIKHEREYILKEHKQDNLSFKESIKNIKIKIIKKEEKYLEFDLIGADCSVANALRRILTAEIPSIAAEKILVYENTGNIPEEILAQRIGLIPIERDPENTELKDKKFSLTVKNKNKNVLDVFSDSIVGEENFFKKGVLITKLGPNQSIKLEIICNVSIGKDHAKYSPVCPATYRLMPIIKIESVYGEEAEKLVTLFPDGVIGIKDNEAYVKDPRKDFVNREVLRHKEFDNKVWIGREPNHFIFTVESVFLEPMVLLRRAIIILIDKSRKLKEDILNRNK